MENAETLEELAESRDLIYLDNCVLSLDYNLSDLSPSSPYRDIRSLGKKLKSLTIPHSFRKSRINHRKLRVCGRFRNIKQEHLDRQARHAARLLKLVSDYDNIRSDQFVLSEYERYLSLLKCSLEKFRKRSVKRVGKKETRLTEIISLHEQLYSLLDQRSEREYNSAFSVLVGLFLNHPYVKGKTGLVKFADNVSEGDANLVSSAILSATLDRRVAIVTADYDIPDMVLNFGRFYHGRLLPEEVFSAVRLNGVVEVYLSNHNNWCHEFGLWYMCDSNGNYAGRGRVRRNDNSSPQALSTRPIVHRKVLPSSMLDEQSELQGK